MKTLDDVMRSLPTPRRRKIMARVDELIAEEMTLRELRKASSFSQAEIAKKLGVNQEQISRSEGRSDLRISTIRRSVEAMGGTLTLLAEFPNGAMVRLGGLDEGRKRKRKVA